MILPIIIPINHTVPFVRISRWAIAGLTYGHLLLYYIPLALYSWSLPKNSIEGQVILFVIYFLFSSVLYGATWLFNQQFISKKEYYETIGKIK